MMRYHLDSFIGLSMRGYRTASNFPVRAGATIVHLFVLGSSIGACTVDVERRQSGQQYPSELHAAQGPLDTLKHRVLADSSVLRKPAALVVYGQIIAVADNAADSLVIFLQRPTGEPLGSFGSRPSAGLRSFTAWSLHSINQELRVFDPFMRRIAIVRLGQDETRVQNVDSAPSVLYPAFLPDGRFIAAALRIPSRLGLFTPAGKLERPIGPEVPGSPALPIYVRQHASIGKPVLHPAGHLVALAGRYSDAFEVYDTAGNEVVKALPPVGFEPVYHVGMRGGALALGMLPNSRIGYVAAAADSNFVYALYSGRTIGSFGSRAYYGNTVHVYTWSGAIQNMFALENDALAIDVTSDGRWLYAVSDRPASLVVYPIQMIRNIARP